MASPNPGRTQQHGVNIADIMMDGANRIVDLQASTLRVLLKAQGRTAAMFGIPDWSQAVVGPDHLSRIAMSGAQQALNVVRHTNETLGLVRQQIGQIVEQQAAQVAEQMRQGAEEVSRRTEQTLEEFRQTTQQTIEELQRAGEEQVRELQQAANEPRSRRRA